ncbi:MAG: glucosamine-6-phosphate deaminase [Bacteroidetes bacterium]|nr:glucosamine-6-phosphate deaminase [Bacteroidota bacterium]
MNIEVLEDYETLSNHAAWLIASLVEQKPEAVICIASGHTPLGVLKRLVEMSGRGEVDLHRCRFIGLDEWVGIPPEQEGSCSYFVEEFLLKPLKINREQIFFFDSMAADLEAECRKMDTAIARFGGLDLMLVGIGLNGHIALNEPGTPWNLYAHLSVLDEMTVTVGQKYFTEKTKMTHGITLGLQHLREARLPVLMASGSGKAAVVQQALEGEVTERLPASIFQTLPHGLVLLDEAAANDLNR